MYVFITLKAFEIILIKFEQNLILHSYLGADYLDGAYQLFLKLERSSCLTQRLDH